MHTRDVCENRRKRASEGNARRSHHTCASIARLQHRSDIGDARGVRSHGLLVDGVALIEGDE